MSSFCSWTGGSSSIWFKQIRDFKSSTMFIVGFKEHGNSKSTLKTAFKSKYTFSDIADDIIEVLDFRIQKSHFVGISLGTILIRQLAEMQPHRVETMILGGAILRMNFRSQILMRLGNMQICIIWYCIIFCFCNYANKNHKHPDFYL